MKNTKLMYDKKNTKLVLKSLLSLIFFKRTQVGGGFPSVNQGDPQVTTETRLVHGCWAPG